MSRSIEIDIFGLDLDQDNFVVDVRQSSSRYTARQQARVSAVHHKLGDEVSQFL